MNTLQKATDWFIQVKAPELKGKVQEVVGSIDAGYDLSEKQKELLGFIFFSYSMNNGPSSFIEIEIAAEEFVVTNEMSEWAQKWINHAKTIKIK